MTVYARGDLAYVFVSSAHEGCGEGHGRPVERGAPAKVWALTCGSCEDFLRHDPHWSTTISEIPDTHDEKIMREDLEKRGVRNQQQMTALALAKIAGIPGAEQALGVALGSADGLACPDGHPCPPGARFCAECGQKVETGEARMFPCGHAAAATAKFCPECGTPARPEMPAPPEPEPPAPPPARVQPPEPAPERPPAPRAEPQKATRPSLPPNTRMRGMKRAELAVLAQKAGLGGGGTRQALLDRLIAANNGGGHGGV